MNPPAPAPLEPATQNWLARHARFELAKAMSLSSSERGERPVDPRLDAEVRGFVSWYLDDALVGCIGLVEGQMPLADFVGRFAVQAGIGDRRTAALQPEQVARLDLEVHLLGDSRELRDDAGKAVTGLPSIAAALEPGRDGLWLTHPSGARAFFLPSVWKQLPDADAFVRALARKAGLDPHGSECEACSGAVARAWTMNDHHSRA